MPDSPLNIAANAAKGFSLLQCEQCALQIKRALQAAGFVGQTIEIRAVGGRYFMVCFSYDGGNTSITQNGRHIGVRVNDTVFDNLHPDGTPYADWLRDFDAVFGIEIVNVTDF